MKLEFHGVKVPNDTDVYFYNSSGTDTEPGITDMGWINTGADNAWFIGSGRLDDSPKKEVKPVTFICPLSQRAKELLSYEKKRRYFQ